LKLDPNIVKPIVGMVLLIALGLVWILSDRAHPPTSHAPVTQGK
jgi:hypothetical protein